MILVALVFSKGIKSSVLRQKRKPPSFQFLYFIIRRKDQEGLAGRRHDQDMSAALPN
jgi:hypothetical protein